MRLLKYIFLFSFALSTHCASAFKIEYEQVYRSTNKNEVILIRFENGTPRLLTVRDNGDGYKEEIQMIDDKSCHVYDKANWTCKPTNVRFAFIEYIMFDGTLISPPNFKLVDSK